MASHSRWRAAAPRTLSANVDTPLPSNRPAGTRASVSSSKRDSAPSHNAISNPVSGTASICVTAVDDDAEADALRLLPPPAATSAEATRTEVYSVRPEPPLPATPCTRYASTRPLAVPTYTKSPWYVKVETRSPTSGITSTKEKAACPPGSPTTPAMVQKYDPLKTLARAGRAVR